MKKILATLIIISSFTTVCFSQIDTLQGVQFENSSSNYPTGIHQSHIKQWNRLSLGLSTEGNSFEIEDWRLGAGNLKSLFKVDIDGNVGIGTDGPASNLHIKAENYKDFIALDRTDRPEIDEIFHITPSWDNDQNDQLRIVTNSANIIAFEETGRVGIGTFNPAEALDLIGTMKLEHSKVEGIRFKYTGINSNGWQSIGSNSNGDLVLSSAGTIDGNEHITIQQNTGNVGIGTTDPKSRLAVEGQIRSTEVKVMAEIQDVPDYVFESDYELRTLQETKEYIAENKHLPEVPSAAEIAKNGIDLGAMDMTLLKKIEELTLYMIDMNKRVNELEKENAALKKQVTPLKK